MRVEVVPPNPVWRSAFEVEAGAIAIALGNAAVQVHHVGSTAIEGIYAKPIIDLLVEVSDIAAVDERTQAMTALGYQAMGEYGIPERRYFRKHNSNGVRTHHVHAFQVGSPEIERHLAFRDYINAHPEEARRYSDLKRSLAKQYPDSIEDYMDGKDGFIKAIDRKAAQWRSLTGQPERE